MLWKRDCDSYSFLISSEWAFRLQKDSSGLLCRDTGDINTALLKDPKAPGLEKDPVGLAVCRYEKKRRGLVITSLSLAAPVPEKGTT
jgi:hypothetical protein